ncbi:hypothetical protein LWI29_014691 [Acer saccharum]|uniref:Uncharacterized protein n=1 Tax=Acer saccharum TaxID=4024 RepID=A0AA39RHA5_ACESA|nr:hypothetical protein LWI29_014691 [Acer saccharum]
MRPARANLTRHLVGQPHSAILGSSSLHSSPQPPVHHGCEVISTDPSLSRSIDKGKGVAAKPSRSITKRESSPVPTLWERIRRDTCLISSEEEEEVPLVRNKRPRAGEVGAAPSKETQEVVNPIISIVREGMLTNLKSTKDKRANLETQLSVSLGKVALLEKGHATLEGQLAAATAASAANETVALTAAEREAASKDQ